MIGLGSSSQLGIGIALKLHDQFSAQAARVNQQLLNMRRNTTSALGQAITQYRNQAAGIAAGAAAISYGMYSMAKDGAQFQHSINMAAIVGGKSLGKTRKEMAAFAEDLSKRFLYTPTEIADNMVENIRAGVSGGLEEITRYQVAAATSTGEMLSGPEGVGQKLLGIMNAMGMKFSDTYTVAGRKMSQFARIANATTAASNATMASVYSIGESMEYFSNTASLAGFSLEQALTLVGKLSQANIRGSAAGTALNNMVQQLINSVSPLAGPKKGKAFAAMGVNPKMVRKMINQGRTFEALEYVDTMSRKLPMGDRLGMLNQIFNMRGSRGLVNAFMGGGKSLADIRKEIEQGVVNDVAIKQSKAAANDLFADMKLLHNGFLRFKNAFVEAAGPTVRVILHGLTRGLQMVSRILQTPVGKVLAGIVVVVVPLIGILFAFRAALLTAVIALRGFGTTSAVGGFGSLLNGGLGMMGASRLGGYAGQVTRNAAGRLTVAAGKTAEFAGKVYKGGQLLPEAFLAGGGIAGAARGAGLVSKLTGFLGSAGPWLARGMGFFGRLLPVVGGVWLAVDVLQGIFGFMRDKYTNDEPRTKLDPVFMEYYKNLDQKYFNTPSSESFYNKYGMSRKEKEMAMNQNININLDGLQAMNNNIKKTMAQSQWKDIESQIHFELPDM